VQHGFVEREHVCIIAKGRREILPSPLR
jgi:hypothetical protein